MGDLAKIVRSLRLRFVSGPLAALAVAFAVSVVMLPGTAHAQLTAQQIATIQNQVTAAINTAKALPTDTGVIDPTVQTWCTCAQDEGITSEQLLTGNEQCDDPRRLAILAKAIADLTVGLVNTYGAGAASEIGSIVLASAMNAGVPPTAIGAGLGMAAQQIAQGDGAAGILLAQVMANEGTEAIANCFASTVRVQQLAVIAQGAPNTTAAGAAGGGNPPNGAPGTAPISAGNTDGGDPPDDDGGPVVNPVAAPFVAPSSSGTAS